MSGEIVAGIGFAVELHEMNPKRVVGPLDSLRDAGAGVIAVVAVDDFAVFASSEIVGSAECRLEASRLDLDLVNVHSSFDPILCDCSRDVELM